MKNKAKRLEQTPNNKKRVLIYCRESRDDYGENYERIEVQRDLLIKFCKEKGYTNIIEIVIHDNMTGTDFSRLEAIMDMVLGDEVDVIVMKDSSRLGRNQLESLKFVALLEEYGVELIFENETYDEYFSLRAWFNEIRARDDSRKIKSNLRHKMEQGVFLIRSHYGYIKKGNSLVIDENVDWVVRKIFALYLGGKGQQAIANLLNAEGISTPSRYENNPNRKIAEKWNSQHVRRILTNEVYTGTYISSTTEKVSFKSKKINRKSEDEWIKIKNKHEAIIDDETFQNAQKLLYSKKVNPSRAKEPPPLAGLVFCGKCKKQMYLVKRSKNLTSFVCGKYHKEGQIKLGSIQKGCTQHRVREKELLEIITNHFQNIIQDTDYKNSVYEDARQLEDRKQDLKNKLSRLQINLRNYKKAYVRLYDDFHNNLIPEFIYQSKSEELNNNIKLTNKQIEEIKDSINNRIKIESHIERLNSVIEEIVHDGLKPFELRSIIDKILIYDANEITPADKELYNISDENYEQLLSDGGILVALKYNISHMLQTS